MSRKSQDQQYAEQFFTLEARTRAEREATPERGTLDERYVLGVRAAAYREAGMALMRVIDNGGIIPAMRAPAEVEALTTAQMNVARAAQEVFDAPDDETGAPMRFREEWDALRDALAEWKAATNAFLASVQQEGAE